MRDLSSHGCRHPLQVALPFAGIRFAWAGNGIMHCSYVRLGLNFSYDFLRCDSHVVLIHVYRSFYKISNLLYNNIDFSYAAEGLWEHHQDPWVWDSVQISCHWGSQTDNISQHRSTHRSVGVCTCTRTWYCYSIIMNSQILL